MRPNIDGAPGLTWRKNKYGYEARWLARSDIAKKGFKPRVMRLWAADAEEPEPTAVSIAWIQDCCNRLQGEMLAFNHGEVVEDFNGTIRSLVRAYQTDEDSPYHSKQYKTRELYDQLCKMVVQDIGEKRIAEITARDLLRWHRQYQDRVAMGHSLIGMLRTLCSFGATILGNRDCRELKAMLSDMRFKMPKPRTERLTADMVAAIRKEARRTGRLSIALAQALQFEMTLRQKDVIGEWLPISEPGLSAVTHGNRKWLKGLDWKEVDANFVVTHITSKRQKPIEVNWHNAPMVLEELGGIRRDELPASGPIIVDERTGLPYTAFDFRTAWRKIATAAGVPKRIRNMDTRAGAISEAADAGAPLEKIRQAATHSDIGMTQRYSRGQAEATADVMQMRAANRTKPKT